MTEEERKSIIDQMNAFIGDSESSHFDADLLLLKALRLLGENGIADAFIEASNRGEFGYA